MNTYKLDIHYNIQCQNINGPYKDNLYNKKKLNFGFLDKKVIWHFTKYKDKRNENRLHI